MVVSELYNLQIAFIYFPEFIIQIYLNWNNFIYDIISINLLIINRL